MLARDIMSLILIVGSAFASRSSHERFAARTARRSLPPMPAQTHFKHADTSSSSIIYYDNWAGAVYFSPNNTYEGVLGTFVLPKPIAPRPGANFSSLPYGFSYYAAAVWVGIDGPSPCENIWQTGVDLYVFRDGSVSYYAWSEWYPAESDSADFSNVKFNAGDTIQLNIITSNATSGIAFVRNLSNGEGASILLSGQAALCRANAEWIVEDFYANAAEVPFANFTTAKFSTASAQLVTGGSIGPGGATVVDIEQNGVVLTSASVTNSSVAITYV